MYAAVLGCHALGTQCVGQNLDMPKQRAVPCCACGTIAGALGACCFDECLTKGARHNSKAVMGHTCATLCQRCAVYTAQHQCCNNSCGSAFVHKHRLCTMHHGAPISSTLNAKSSLPCCAVPRCATALGRSAHAVCWRVCSRQP